MERLGWCAREDMISGSFTIATEPLAARRRCVLPSLSAAVRAGAELRSASL